MRLDAAESLSIIDRACDDIFMKKRWIFLWVILVSLLAGCASVNTYHTFYYDSHENDDIKVLDWAYSNQKMPGYRVKEALSGGGGAGRVSMGLKRVGDFLYIKWQALPSPTIHEARVDLRPLLPWNMNQAEVRPSFNSDNELEIYLAIPSERAQNFFIFREKGYAGKVLKQIYPVMRNIETVAVELKK